MNPYQPGKDNQDPYTVGYKAGAASRDAEVASMKEQRDRAIDTCTARENEIIDMENKLASRDAEVAELKVVSDHNLATYHQAAELLRAEITDLRRVGLDWHGKFITETETTELLREQVTILRGYCEAQLRKDKAASYERCPDCDYEQKCSLETGCLGLKDNSPIMNKALAASRDAEVTKLKDDNEYLYVAAIERDQLREQVKMLRDALEITHDLYANASSGYGFARPENPHNFTPDIDCCSKDEIEAHSKACSDYDAGNPLSDDSWGIGTYCDEYLPAIKALAATQDLSNLVLCEAEPVAWMQDNGCYFSVAEDEFHEIPLFKARKP